MAGITLTQAEEQLQVWLDASIKVATNQAYSINGRSLTRADAKEIREQINFWEQKISLLSRASSGRGRTRYAVNQ
jgi:hypothetical protein